MYNPIFVLFLLTFLISCKKDPAIVPASIPEPVVIIDERDAVKGTYTGIKVENLFNFNTFLFEKDTTNIIMILTKSSTDSVIDVSFSGQLYPFKYHNNIFTGMTAEPPTLTKSNDSLYYHYQPSLSLEWTDCKVKKQ